MTMQQSVPIPLLWTGGWDSTFRLLQAVLVQKQAVQPYYLIDRLHYRPGVPEEQKAMQKIRDVLASKDREAAARLLPTITTAVAEITLDSQLNAAYEKCLKIGFIGGQYEWLANYCLLHGIDGMELSIHKDDKARNLLEPLIDVSRSRLDTRHTGDGRYELFKRFRFPIFDKTKQEMREEARLHGFEDLMLLTWFCHRPRRGQPCGTCNPCIYTIDEGLGDRIPPLSRLRYHVRVVPRVRHWLTRHPHFYGQVRALYRRVRGRSRASATVATQS
ncbi:MAG TPA: hypothetical protein VFS47_03910 [Steroidobacteraceae bacterium]|jgi:hypothetical protein|nr:hypothetical protein [Steroidobacteraceae bacterium]